MSTLSEKAIEFAETQLNETEKPIGSNWGEPVKSYLASVGITFPASWCAAFCYWSFNKAANELNIKNPVPKTGGCLAMWKKSGQKNITPSRGSIGIMDHGHGLGHAVIVESVDGDSVHTIEGNTNDTGSREGYEVCHRVRKINTFVAFLNF